MTPDEHNETFSAEKEAAMVVWRTLIDNFVHNLTIHPEGKTIILDPQILKYINAGNYNSSIQEHYESIIQRWTDVFRETALIKEGIKDKDKQHPEIQEQNLRLFDEIFSPKNDWITSEEYQPPDPRYLEYYHLPAPPKVYPDTTEPKTDFSSTSTVNAGNFTPTGLKSSQTLKVESFFTSLSDFAKTYGKLHGLPQATNITKP